MCEAFKEIFLDSKDKGMREGIEDGMFAYIQL